MELKVYGHWGVPVLIFPSQGGRYHDFEDYGMVDACRSFIDDGRIKLYAVDSVDNQSWANFGAHPADRGRRHEDYDRYIVHECLPFVRDDCGGRELACLTAGCSMGGYHAVNFFLRHPDAFGGCISMSGMFDLRLFVGDYMDDTVYFNSPLCYLPDTSDPWYLERYRQGRVVVCVGQGDWEEPMIAAARDIKGILQAKGIWNWVDFWGHDVSHDWPWWRRQWPYLLGVILDG
jgi:esterase/lipase superfamily enzyme